MATDRLRQQSCSKGRSPRREQDACPGLTDILPLRGRRAETAGGCFRESPRPAPAMIASPVRVSDRRFIPGQRLRRTSRPAGTWVRAGKKHVTRCKRARPGASGALPARPAGGASLPTVTARRVGGTRYPRYACQFWSASRPSAARRTGCSVRSLRMPAPPGRRRSRITQSDPSGWPAAEPGATRLHPAVTSSGEEHGDLELAAAGRTGPSGQGSGNRRGNPRQPAGRGPGRLAAGSCRSGPGIRIGNPARRRVLVLPGSETCRGVPQAGHPGLGVVALGDDSGDAPGDASQWPPYALPHVVVHRSSSVSGHLFAGHH